MKLFIIHWEANNIIDDNIIIFGFGYTYDKQQIILSVNDFIPYKYSKIIHKDFKYIKEQKYILREYSKGKQTVYKHFFNNSKDYNLFNNNLVTQNITDLFLLNFNLPYVGWIEINNEILIENNIINCSCKYIKYIESDIIIYPKIFSFDIECLCYDSVGFPNMYNINDKISMISVIYNYNDLTQKFILYNSKHKSKIIDNTEYTSLYYDNEIKMLIGFFELIDKLNVDIIIGYNIYMFDFKYMSRRIGYYPNIKLKGSRIPNKDIQIKDLSNYLGTNILIPGRINIDLYSHIKTLNLSKNSLDYVSKLFLNEHKIDLPYTRMFELLHQDNSESLKIVADYCIKDSILTLKLFNTLHLWIQIKEISNISHINIINIFDTGQSAKYKNLLHYYCFNNDILINKDYNNTITSYEGAKVLVPKPGLYNFCTMLDFTSLYPSVIITHNICYTTFKGIVKCNYIVDDHYEDDEDNYYIFLDNVKYIYTKKYKGILPIMFKYLLNERVKYKNLLKTTNGINKIIFDKRQYALKIQANSIYGCLGSRNLIDLRFLYGAICTTGTGRIYLNKTVNIINENTFFKVIYGDTDSCLIKCDYIIDKDLFIKESIRIANYVTSLLPKGMHLKYENTFKKLILLTKKKYSGIRIEGNLYTKGMDIVKNNICNFIKNTYKTVLDDILIYNKNKDYILNFINESKKNLLDGKVNINDLIMTVSIGKKYKSNTNYIVLFIKNMKTKYNLNYTYGTKVNYIIIKNNSKLLGDKMLPIEVYNANINLLEIDYEYYLNHYFNTSLNALLNII
ncbi:DNA/RNA polymerase [Anaeromyces robustus]|uniref:DNA polymerase delta catalytic subunit n=1 Tax=Anaeromyces robustus TaxID=1754192 RepID=A0A1Y1VVQ4_9FUNG|nr:DNA/RNA polymerase [Anaeromyces robustus]|eukprot:ORX64844.1 DNA/RNA polymerase [Anaeromyces robustus]